MPRRPRVHSGPALLVSVALIAGGCAPAVASPAHTIAQLRKENSQLKRQLRAQSQLISRSFAHTADAVELLRRLLGGQGSLGNRVYEALALVGQTGSLAERLQKISATLGGDGDLAGRVDAALGQIAKLQDDLAGQTDATQAERRQVDALTALLAAANSDKSALQGQVGTLTGQLAGLEADKTVLQTQVTGLLADKAALQTQVTGLQADKTALQTQVTGLQADNSALQTQVTGLQADKSALQSEIDAAKDALGGSGTLAARINAITSALGTFDGSDPAYPLGVGMATPLTVTTRLNDVKTVLGFGGADIATDLKTLNTTQLGASAITSTAARLSSLAAMIGGIGSLSFRVQGLDFGLLASPTGVLSDDLATAAALLVTTPSGVLQSDIGTLNALVNGTASGSTTQARIGDPTTGTSGLAGMIRNNGSAVNNTGTSAYDTKFTAFNNATSLTGQLTAFLDVYTVNPAGGRLEWDNPQSLSSLRAVLTAALDN